MMDMKRIAINTLCGCSLLASIAWSTHAVALTISDFDLTTFDFDIINYDAGSNFGSGGNATASGTSNGIGWSIGPTRSWVFRTVTDGSFNFSALPNSTDNLHPSIDFTITFDETIESLLVALSNDNHLDSINFGLVPTDVLGVSVTGTQITLNNASGGLALFENVNSLTVSHANNNGFTDGFDLAFHAIPQKDVPEPFSVLGPMLSLGVAVFFLKRA